MKESTRVLIALGVAVAAERRSASREARRSSALRFLTPAGTLWVNAIRMTVIPLMVSLLITGVAAATAVKSVGRIGGRTLLVFVLLLVGTAVVVMPASLAVFRLLPPHGAAVLPLPAGAAEAAGQIAAGGQAQTFSTWLTSLLPSNPIAAAATGAMMRAGLLGLEHGDLLAIA